MPAAGYRAYELRRTVGAQPGSRAAHGNVLRSADYRVAVDPLEGCATSIVDVALGRDLVDGDSPFGLGQYVYDRILDPLRPTRRADTGTGAPAEARLAPGARVLASRSTPSLGVVTSRTSSEVEERLTVRLAADGAELLETTFTLVHGVRRLELAQRLVKRPTVEKESVSFTFPFAVTAPTRWYELTGGAVSPDAPRVPGSATHVNAIRHWVALQDAAVTVAWATLEAPLVQLGDLYSPLPAVRADHRRRRSGPRRLLGDEQRLGHELPAGSRAARRTSPTPSRRPSPAPTPARSATSRPRR